MKKVLFALFMVMGFTGFSQIKEVREFSTTTEKTQLIFSRTQTMSIDWVLKVEGKTGVLVGLREDGTRMVFDLKKVKNKPKKIKFKSTEGDVGLIEFSKRGRKIEMELFLRSEKATFEYTNKKTR